MVQKNNSFKFCRSKNICTTERVEWKFGISKDARNLRRKLHKQPAMRHYSKIELIIPVNYVEIFCEGCMN